MSEDGRCRIVALGVLKGTNPETPDIIDKDYARDKDRVFYTRQHFRPSRP